MGRQAASGVGRNCCFWRAACFRSEVNSWNGRLVQYFLTKAPQLYPRSIIILKTCALCISTVTLEAQTLLKAAWDWAPTHVLLVTSLSRPPPLQLLLSLPLLLRQRPRQRQRWQLCRKPRTKIWTSMDRYSTHLPTDVYSCKHQIGYKCTQQSIIQPPAGDQKSHI